ncbi:hypothetical protein VD0004_g3966 [Verticillium dahliae]|nr:hypothetical protein VD0004_g3966 [Verticillium dahliae]PNH74758.1 hypothetical protein VD0001_g2796 [Verticillium dahliae]
MAYPPPPGISNASSNSSHPSLPARPPPAASASSGGNGSGGGFKSSFKPAFTPAQSSYSGAPSYGAGSAPAAGQYGPSSYPTYQQPASSMSAAPYQAQSQPYRYPQQPQQPSSSSTYQQGAYSAPASAASYGAGPQIRNPFPAPGTAAAADPSYDPELAAQIAQWQSAYSGRDATGASSSTPGSAPSTIPGPDPDAAAAAAAAATAAAAAIGDRKKTVVREGGGKKWTDDTLVEWDPSHLRLFVGNLAGEVTDESLLKAFARWPSVAKARVVRDKRTSKSKGFGFVAFSDADDFFQAAKEMNGKYIQSHPVVVRKANTEIKVTNVKEKGRGKHGKDHKNKNRGGSGSGVGGRQEGGGDATLGPVHHGGVSKPGQKTKNGLRLLG